MTKNIHIYTTGQKPLTCKWKKSPLMSQKGQSSQCNQLRYQIEEKTNQVRAFFSRCSIFAGLLKLKFLSWIFALFYLDFDKIYVLQRCCLWLRKVHCCIDWRVSRTFKHWGVEWPRGVDFTIDPAHSLKVLNWCWNTTVSTKRAEPLFCQPFPCKTELLLMD